MVADWASKHALMNRRLSELDISADAKLCLTEAASRSANAIENAIQLLQARKDILDLTDDIVAYGSLARFELTQSSDLDYLVISSDQSSSNSIPIDELRSKIVPGIILNEPGKTGIFGRNVSRSELTENIGLQQDTNETLTRRILFLEESVSLFKPEYHQEVLTEIIGKYLTTNRRSGEVPRFLVNDIIRYWRTIAVDYQAKAEQKGLSGLRYLKLLIPRKLCFISSLAPLHKMDESSDADQDQKLADLVEHYSEPSIIRLLNFLVDLSQKDPCLKPRAKTIVETLALFIQKSEDPSWRTNVITEADSSYPNGTSNYGFMRSKAKLLHEEVGTLMLSDPMKDFTKQFLVV